MAIYKNYSIKKLRDVGDDLGRSGVSEQVGIAVNDCSGTPKDLMELCGKLLVIADMSTFDSYWQEQVQRGVSKQEHVIALLTDDYIIKQGDR